jgi:hypothetical protein
MRKILFGISSLIVLTMFAMPAHAVELSVEAPNETLTRGQTFDFKVNIDTQGKSITKQSIIFSYDKTLVEFANILEAGDFFDSVGYQPDPSGKILLVGESAKAKSGTGLVAIVKMKIIATSAGSTQLCSAVPLDITPTVTPPRPSPTTRIAQPTARPTTPVTGSATNMIGGTVIGLMLMMISMTVLMII